MGRMPRQAALCRHERPATIRKTQLSQDGYTPRICTVDTETGRTVLCEPGVAEMSTSTPPTNVDGENALAKW